LQRFLCERRTELDARFFIAPEIVFGFGATSVNDTNGFDSE
jgi:hypothetical protein